ncbi:coiled-coil alpha-helical rod protein 1 isoform X3 [Phyllopteryx taeniolatus]|uniref:coiled-coil alpha-helical rod protein 1 isoform X3 n=1 Tax=Phyllopteryx taeniolatus TaxID=161469 RepID=UPI002AD4C15C|nr:coiled-coil alpha-helical rod protein 1 isoform X3 [Phyllopteryx taeniolatus]
MDAHKKLSTPTDFISPKISRKPLDDLVPPSHFASSVQAARLAAGTQPCISWMNPSVSTAPPKDLWLGLPQTRREISTQREENHCTKMLRGSKTSGRTPEEKASDLRTRSSERGYQLSRWEEGCCLEAEKHKAEAERLKEQMEALKDDAQRYREEIRVKNDTISRQCHDLETMHQEMSKGRIEHSQLKEELVHCHAQEGKISSKRERFRKESDEEIAKMTRVGEARELALKAEMNEQQAEEAEKLSLKMSEQTRKKQEEELRQLNAVHCAELNGVRKSNNELQSKLQSVTRERDELKEHLSQMEQAYETQSATLHSLRNYIGQVVADKGEKEQCNEAFERLNKDKVALQKTAELLTVRLNSMSEIVSLQEEKMLKKASTDPLVTARCDGLLVLHIWREKVFKLCVQLRLKDIELRDEKAKHLSEVVLTEQQLQEERHRATVLQRSLDAGIAELDQEKVEKETLEQDLAQACKDNQQLKAKSHSLAAELKSTTEALHGFSVTFHRKIAEVDAARAKLNTFGQRLNFARGRVETVQALFLRRVALHKVRTTSKPAEQTAARSSTLHNKFTSMPRFPPGAFIDLLTSAFLSLLRRSVRNLQMELSLVCQERSKLTQELKRTPQLIEKALADMKEEYENKLRRQQEELEQSRDEMQKAVSGTEEVQRSLRGVLAQLEVSKGTQEELQSELRTQKERSQQDLQQRVSEIESRCAEELREMEVRVSTAKREHTKAVMTLRQFERAVTRKHWRETEALQSEHTKKEVQRKQTEEAETNRHRLRAAVAERELTSDFPRCCAAPQQNESVPREQGGKAAERSCLTGAKPAAEGEWRARAARSFQTGPSDGLTCRCPARETPLCYGGAPNAQCRSGQQL